MLAQAQRQVSLCSLYMGPGALEDALLRAMVDGAADQRPELRVRIVLDGARGSRSGPRSSSATVCAQSLAPLGERGSVWLFDLPHAREWPLRSIARGRAREGLGVMHAKVYAADDQVIIAGANLSEDYFTSRQDRYLVIQDAAVAGLAHRAVEALATGPWARQASSSSSRGEAVMEEAPPYSRTDLARALETALVAKGPSAPQPVSVEAAWQVSVAGVRCDSARLERALEACGQGDRVDVASGYCNLHPRMLDRLASAAARGARVRVLTAGPTANGFLGGAGIAGAVPIVYSLLLRDMARSLAAQGVLLRCIDPSPSESSESTSGQVSDSRSGSVELLEWAHPADREWCGAGDGIGIIPPGECERHTFHAKGLWIETAHGEVLTSSGGSNFGRRSDATDLELQLWLGPVPVSSPTGRVLLSERDALFRADRCRRVDDKCLSSPARSLRGMFRWDTGWWIAPARRVLQEMF